MAARWAPALVRAVLAVVALGLAETDRAGGQVRSATTAPPKREWDGLARELLAEANLLRRGPAGYAGHLDAMLSRFDGPLLERPGRPFLRTDEGAAAVREAIAVRPSG